MSNIKTDNNGCRGRAGPGRPKGSVNKVSGILKDAILLAAENAGNEDGGNGLVSYLEKQAVDHPTAFMTLLGKVLPMQVAAEVEVAPPSPTDHNPRQLARAVLQLIHKANVENEKENKMLTDTGVPVG